MQVESPGGAAGQGHLGNLVLVHRLSRIRGEGMAECPFGLDDGRSEEGERRGCNDRAAHWQRSSGTDYSGGQTGERETFGKKVIYARKNPEKNV